MSRFIFIFLFGIFSFPLASQSYTISGTISGLSDKELYLIRIKGDSRKVTDTVRTDLTGAFVFNVEEDFPVGQYGIITGKGQMVEILFNKEDIRFVTTGAAATDQVQIIESVENLLYYKYLNIKSANLYRLDVLYPVIQYYPGEDPFYATTLNEVRKLQQEIKTTVASITLEYPQTMAARFITVDDPVFANPEQTMQEQTAYLKAHYFEDEDFLDTLILRSNILTSKIISYLSLYQDNRLKQEQLEDQLIMAVDTVLEKAFVDQTVYEFVVNFLIGGFEAIGFEKGLEHIANHNLLSELCVNTERKKALENKMELIRRLAIGQTAPDFEAMNMEGEKVRLSEIDSEKTVLVFWASWCPHCEDILPRLKNYYDPSRKNKLEIIGISIDENEAEWKAAVAESGYNWINIAELQGWDGPIIDAYGISATPYFFVLDKDKRIIGKPANDREIEDMLGGG